MEKDRKNIRKNKKITLIIFIITIIILFILAGISISKLTQEGIFAEKLENQMLADNESQLNTLGKSTVGSGDVTGGSGDQSDGDDGQGDDPNIPSTTTSVADARTDYMKENTEVTDENGNTLVVPAGFKITEDANNVTEGIVIEDKEGNQFVWVPVGEVKIKDQQPQTITLSRYTFATDGKEKDEGENKINKYYQELATPSNGNAIAKNIKEFKKSATENNGYFIGRYEARKSSNKVTEKSTDGAWLNIGQEDASKNSQEMYADNNDFTSDLINSYAWDTAIVFIQKFGGDPDYSIYGNYNDSYTEGDYNDSKCNIFDMANDNREWTTESYCYSTTYTGCVYRGGYQNGTSKTCSRNQFKNNVRGVNMGFRPILYCSTES